MTKAALEKQNHELAEELAYLEKVAKELVGYCYGETVDNQAKHGTWIGTASMSKNDWTGRSLLDYVWTLREAVYRE